ncbi:MAG: methyltransferase domain-containing protein [Bacteroidia bacterium]|nr:methyltransferase domain-containing protein [Bacteroidia bacterium]MCX7651659.1 methyltransferase domain-containing protein [Bacteroidia bacterium]MDW8417193.1 methyltransferase domain-containing protein [Bacteroidia bacterium]
MRWLICLLLSVSQSWAWGFWAHRRINRLAVFSLPETLFAFYRNHIEYITRQATKPDERRMAFSWEPPRHYIDLDRYPPNLPHRWQEAVELLSIDTLHAHGMLPWHLEAAFWDLVEAFRKQNTPQILKLSAEIGHYIGDAHVPLHTTANYNGQLTGQQGIHALWEALLPEQYGETYDYWVGQAKIWRSVRDTLWKVIYESHALVSVVLQAERTATHQVGEIKKYTYRIRGNQTIRTYSAAFIETYHTLLEGMVESRLRKAIHRLASLWLTAWHLAGRPVLSPVSTYIEESFPYDSSHIDHRCGEGKFSQTFFRCAPTHGSSALPFEIPKFNTFTFGVLSLSSMNRWFASPYYALLYAHRDDDEAARFVGTILRHISLPTPAYALDAGCGEGRYARALAKAGLVVDAIDVAVSTPNVPEGVRFYQKDLRTWEPDRHYHLIGSFFTSLGLEIQRWDEVKSIVRRLASWLLPGGWLVIDYTNIHKANPVTEEELVINDNRFIIKRWQDSFMLHKSIQVYPADGSSPTTYEENVLKLTEGDLYQIIERAGLEIKATWGDYDGQLFQLTDSPRLIFLAQKPVS